MKKQTKLLSAALIIAVCAVMFSACGAQAKTFTVTFDKQGGVGGVDSVTATYGKTMPQALAPVKSGYTFGGYYTLPNGAGTQYYDAEMKSVKAWDIEGNTTLYAKWTYGAVIGEGNWDGQASTYLASNKIHTGIHYVEYGNFPKSYVGDSLNTELNTAYNAGSLINGMALTGKSYTVNTIADTESAYGGNTTNNWIPTTAAEYSFNGGKYVRKIMYSARDYNTASVNTFADGTTFATDQYYWFNVEPIRWLIANWDELPKSVNPSGAGTATSMKLAASEEITAGVPFFYNATAADRTMWKNSAARSYLNEKFLNEAFTVAERNAILASTVANNDGNGVGYDAAAGAGASFNTTDKIFLLSYYEVFTGGDYYNIFNTTQKQWVYVSDFALANFAFSSNGTSYPRIGVWWLRSAYSSSYVRYVYSSSSVLYTNPNLLDGSLRPAFVLALS